jgi:hypothetical protein
MNEPIPIPNAPLQETKYRPVQLAENLLTKREEFAKAAMQGLCANVLSPEWSFARLSQLARKQADALIAELDALIVELDAHPNP